MTLAGVFALVAALLGWRVGERHRRQVRAASLRLERCARADERAALASLRPSTGHVLPFTVNPPEKKNGTE